MLLNGLSVSVVSGTGGLGSNRFQGLQGSILGCEQALVGACFPSDPWHGAGNAMPHSQLFIRFYRVHVVRVWLESFKSSSLGNALRIPIECWARSLTSASTVANWRIRTRKKISMRSARLWLRSGAWWRMFVVLMFLLMLSARMN